LIFFFGYLFAQGPIGMPGKIGNAGTEGHMGIPGKGEKLEEKSATQAPTECHVFFYVTGY
jgi:hypothetical protein